MALILEGADCSLVLIGKTTGAVGGEGIIPIRVGVIPINWGILSAHVIRGIFADLIFHGGVSLGTYSIRVFRWGHINYRRD